MKPLHFLILCLLLSGSCKQSDKRPQEPSDISTETNPTPDSGVVNGSTSPADTTIADIVNPPSAEEEAATPPIAKAAPREPAKPKICAPNFTKLASYGSHHIFYITDFVPEEFKCWVLLEEHGVQICNGSPCVVYYVDRAQMKTDPNLPHHMKEEDLRTAGVGRFEYTGKYWEIKGASQWKRKDKGYGYYNTDNQLGG